MSKAAELAALIGSQTALSNRNLIINGAMQVAQRGDVTGITGESYGGPDRFELNASSIGTFTISQSSTAPTGFKNSWKVDCTTADASPASGDLLLVSYRIEGQDLQQLAYGTSGAKAITLSFYVRSNKTGTYNVQFQQIDNSFKQAVLSYTISSADTWEFKSITVPGDTSGLINDDNGDGLALFWILGAGSTFTSGGERSTYTAFANGDVAPTQTVNLADNTANEWMITGVQLEVGEQATPFEHRSFGDELQRCMRYYEKSYDYDTAPGTTAAYPGNLPLTIRGMDEETSGQRYFVDNLKVEKRADPTNTYYDEQGNTGKVTTYDSGGTGTHNVSIGLVVTESSKYGAGPGNSAIWGFGFFYECDAEL